MSFLTDADVARLISDYGYSAVALLVAIESMGVPVPGELALIVASIYAGRTHDLEIGWIVAAAAFGAIAGDNLGFWIGRKLGYNLLLRYGSYLGMSDGRIRLGQYLFRRHGGSVVFLGRFFAVLRALAACLAGINQMPWPRFLVFNAAGGVAWTMSYGFSAYFLGTHVHRLLGPVGIVSLVAGCLAIGVALISLHRHQVELQIKAERELPGPLRAALPR